MPKSVFAKHNERKGALERDTLYDPDLSNEALEAAGHEHIIRAKAPEQQQPHKALAQEGKQPINEE
jgi:hypothetical protein